MNTPMITWVCIVALVLILAAVRVAYLLMRRFNLHFPAGMVGMISEREEFFVPGDAKTSDDDEDD